MEHRNQRITCQITDLRTLLLIKNKNANLISRGCRQNLTQTTTNFLLIERRWCYRKLEWTILLHSKKNLLHICAGDFLCKGRGANGIEWMITWQPISFLKQSDRRISRTKGSSLILFVEMTIPNPTEILCVLQLCERIIFFSRWTQSPQVFFRISGCI